MFDDVADNTRRDCSASFPAAETATNAAHTVPTTNTTTAPARHIRNGRFEAPTTGRSASD